MAAELACTALCEVASVRIDHVGGGRRIGGRGREGGAEEGGERDGGEQRLVGGDGGG